MIIMVTIVWLALCWLNFLQKSLELLEDKDPEFFKYLQEHDKTLLDFDLSDDDNEGEEDQSALDEDEEEDQGGESSSDSEIGKEEAVGSDDQDDVEEADSRSIITSQMVREEGERA